MRVLFVHNRYRSQSPSGENIAVDRERELLQSAGHDVAVFGYASDSIASFGPGDRLALPGRVVWSRRSQRDITRFLNGFRPDIIHVHNTFPLISPSILAPCSNIAPVVVSFHNYRTVCPQGLLLRDGLPCESCVGAWPWPALRYGCYRDSRVATFPIAVAVGVHRALDIWNKYVSGTVALSEFARARLIAGGLDASRMTVLPNFAPVPGTERLGAGRHYMSLGRLSFEKSPMLLLEAWRAGFGELVIAGDGPLLDSVEVEATRHEATVRVVGYQSPERAMSLLADARALIITSRAYEVSPLVLAEAFARGVPVIAPAHGAFAEFIADGGTGRLFPSADAVQLARCMEELLDDSVSRRMGAAARAAYEARFHPQQHLAGLLDIYNSASRAS